MKCNRLTCLMAVFPSIMAVSSCMDVKRPEPPAREHINVTSPSKEAAAISQLTASIDDISANLDVISSQEAQLCKVSEHTNKKSKIIRQIRNLGALLAEKHAQINKSLDETARHAKGERADNTTVINLRKMIDFLVLQLREKEERVAKLEELASRKDVSLEQLKYIIKNQSEGVDALRYRFSMASVEQEYLQMKVREKQSESQSDEVYYIIADKQTLKEKGLLKTTLFSRRLNIGNITKDGFTKADGRELKELIIKSKSPKLLSMNPESSYELTENEDGTTTLRITEPEKFWNVSRYLVVLE
ncbi:MAG: hypothetical protein K6A82_03085 [Prevotella sp.]|nr:hypothetical protein [Prevotella sp.]